MCLHLLAVSYQLTEKGTGQDERGKKGKAETNADFFHVNMAVIALVIELVSVG